MRRSHLSGMVLIVLIGTYFAVGQRWAREGNTSTSAASATKSKTAPLELQVPGSPVKREEPVANAIQPASPRVQVSAPRELNLFATFQSAINSSDKRALEAGLLSWRTCERFVDGGTSDVETWVAAAIPAGLSKPDWERRAQYARGLARRCAGFAMQADSRSLAEEMRRRAIEVGSASEILRERSRQASGDAEISLEDAACASVLDFRLSDDATLGPIGPALRMAALRRSDHILSSLTPEARFVSANMALCDLVPGPCGTYSNFSAEACLKRGRCDYASEEDFWRDEAGPAWKDAQPARRALVEAVRAGKCDELFR